ncbi:MAG: zf-HC2 domain-containing protein [Polyangiaceae bacterium]
MDCEKFDRIVLDLLYEELDELTQAAAKRHMDQCSRCRPIATELRATREVGVLPMVEPPDELEQRILAAERTARKTLPFGQRVGRAVSVLAGYAMRPQLAMAALLLLLIGSSLLLLRAKPGETENISVTERGVPETEGPGVAILPAAPADEAPVASPEPARVASRGAADAPTEAPGAAAEGKAEEQAADKSKDTGDDTFSLAMNEYRNGNWVAAQAGFDRVETQGGSNAAQAALFSAQAVRNASGCTSAGPRFETVTVRYPGTAITNDARWQAADCFRSTGQLEKARKHYQALVGQPGYDDRARKALAQMDEATPRVASKAAAAPAKAKPAAKPAAEPQATATASAPSPQSPPPTNDAL